MNRKQKVHLLLSSSAISLVTQVTRAFLTFFIRKQFFAFLGAELQGIYDVLNNVLGMIQLAELGVGTAIVYALYLPLSEKDTDTVNKLMKLYKTLYQKIGILILAIGIILSFKLPFIISSTKFSSFFVQGAFLIMLCSTATTYFLAYKRNLLYADQKQYVYQIIDIVISIIAFGLQVIAISIFESFYVFLTVAIIQNISSNLIVWAFCRKHYPYLQEESIGEYEGKKRLSNDVKNIFIGKIGGYVYNSTDNLIISKMVGVTAVSLLTNYTYITSMCKTICSSITAPVRPMLGNYVNDKSKNKNDVKKVFDDFTFLMFVIQGIAVTGVLNTSNLFISMWIGPEIHLQSQIILLLCIDMFLGSIQSPAGELVNVLGYFKFDKYMSIAGMVINLVFSILLVFSYGIEGVLVGTVFAQFFYFISRTIYLHETYFNGGIWKYWFDVIKYIVAICIDVAIVRCVMLRLTQLPTLIQFLGGAVLSCVTPVTVAYILYRKSTVYVDLKNKFIITKKNKE